MGLGMSILGPLAAVLALVAGIIILVRPRILNTVIALYLIIVGILGLIGPGGTVPTPRSW